MTGRSIQHTILLYLILTVSASILAGQENTAILFCSDRDGDNDIYMMDPDGSGVEILLENDSDEYGLAVAPDGSQVAFVSDIAGNADIYILDLENGSVECIIDNPQADFMPTWSPDGTVLTFVSEADGDREIYHYFNDDSIQQLTDNDVLDDLPDWSPDGSQILFCTDRTGSTDIWVMDADGGNPEPVTSGSVGDFMPDWSPDGSLIVFERYIGPFLELFIMDANGGNIEQLTFQRNDCHEPEWSADGDLILFVARPLGNYEIFTIDPDNPSTSTVNLTNNPAMDWAPSWRSPAAVNVAKAHQPAGLELIRAFPNPFNMELTIQFRLDRSTRLRLSISDISGREVLLLGERFFNVGENELTWSGLGSSGHSVDSGVYFLHLAADDMRLATKLILMK